MPNTASARLYAKACALDAKCANDVSMIDRRENAARSAVLAGCRQGSDVPDEIDAQVLLRTQGRVWLETNRQLLVRRLASGTATDRKYVIDRLTRWLADKDLTGTRTKASREVWTAAEVTAWDNFWSDVQTLLDKANDGLEVNPMK